MTNQPIYDELDYARAEALAVLLQHVGYALWQIAECEDALAHLVVIRLRESQSIGQERGDHLLRAIQVKTFGQVLREFKDKGILAAALEQRLQHLLKERNWLVHDSKRENRGALNDLTQYNRLTTRLTEMAAEATELNKGLGSEIEEYVVSSGVPREQIDDDAKTIAESWGYE